MGAPFAWGGTPRTVRDAQRIPPAGGGQLYPGLRRVARGQVREASVAPSLWLRRARCYRRALADPANDSFQLIEKTIKLYRTHRDAGRFDARFIRD
eukprot:SAG25_NODE_5910_length_607_cov_0.781496_1_plen_95_part_10